MSHDRAAAVNEAAARFAPRIVAFLRDMIAIPSESAGERAVLERGAAEMRPLGFVELKI